MTSASDVPTETETTSISYGYKKNIVSLRGVWSERGEFKIVRKYSQ